jgi:hypothetical protein
MPNLTCRHQPHRFPSCNELPAKQQHALLDRSCYCSATHRLKGAPLLLKDRHTPQSGKVVAQTKVPKLKFQTKCHVASCLPLTSQHTPNETKPTTERCGHTCVKCTAGRVLIQSGPPSTHTPATGLHDLTVRRSLSLSLSALLQILLGGPWTAFTRYHRPQQAAVCMCMADG